MPMQSTGKEKFTAYIYFKTEKYDPKDPWSESDSDDASEDSDDEEASSDETILSLGKRGKQTQEKDNNK